MVLLNDHVDTEDWSSNDAENLAFAISRNELHIKIYYIRNQFL